MNRDARIGVVGATGAVGTVTLRLLRERGYENVRAFASERSAGRTQLGSLTVEEATAEALLAGGLDLVLFSVRHERVPRARARMRSRAARSSSTSRARTGSRTATRSSSPR